MLYQTIRPRKVKAGRAGDTTWQWDAGLPLLVRCPLELLQHGVGVSWLGHPSSFAFSSAAQP